MTNTRIKLKIVMQQKTCLIIGKFLVLVG